MSPGPRPRRTRVAPAFQRPVSLAAPDRVTRHCQECGGAIGARRSRAMPATTRCLHCQRSVEQAGTPT
ncbi:MAG: TraR/DksA C4-type zinc finger protein [Thermoleophilaceae bacterium]